MAMLGSVVVEDISKPDLDKIDREKTCPLLLRVFCSTGRHNSPMDYTNGNTPANELQIYTWLDATLKEIAGLVKEVNPDARRHGTVFDFSLVYPDKYRGYRSRPVSTIVSGQKNPDDNKTLTQIRFTIGDYLDISITPPSRSRVIYGRGNKF
ncbi:histone deacetylase complex subunit SAP18 [Folsomia candida]|uniref:18 kDa Sin3-associated polypeptide n=1 Tax=Folsomia candida TaxID=158441 RepID=A0A226F5R0_FOLCA|nr:histone deacetylase complex subunit SAP18 [Folsomia candida]OXA65122.1 Histone deacetylase complex subunit SAP18 [Folsomia candida]